MVTKVKPPFENLMKDVSFSDTLFRIANKVNRFFLFLNQIRFFKFSQANMICLNNMNLYSRAFGKILALPKFLVSCEKLFKGVKKYCNTQAHNFDGDKIFQVIKRVLKAICSLFILIGVCLELKILSFTPWWVLRGKGCFLIFTCFYALFDFIEHSDSLRREIPQKTSNMRSLGVSRVGSPKKGKIETSDLDQYKYINKFLKLFIAVLYGLVFLGIQKKWRWNFALIKKIAQPIEAVQLFTTLFKKTFPTG